MTWRQLLREKRVEKRPADKVEIDQLRTMVERQLKDAAISALSEEQRFIIAYDAARLIATMAIRSAGYRVKEHHGFHYNTFQAFRIALGSSIADITAYLDQCRKKRNLLTYDAPYSVATTEVDELLQKVKALKQTVEIWIADH